MLCAAKSKVSLEKSFIPTVGQLQRQSTAWGGIVARTGLWRGILPVQSANSHQDGPNRGGSVFILCGSINGYGSAGSYMPKSPDRVMDSDEGRPKIPRDRLDMPKGKGKAPALIPR